MPREGTTRIGGRTIAYLEAGDLAGPLVLHNHGGPSSRREPVRAQGVGQRPWRAGHPAPSGTRSPVAATSSPSVTRTTYLRWRRTIWRPRRNDNRAARGLKARRQFSRADLARKP